jgi:hypothetical protein
MPHQRVVVTQADRPADRACIQAHVGRFTQSDRAKFRYDTQQAATATVVATVVETDRSATRHDDDGGPGADDPCLPTGRDATGDSLARGKRKPGARPDADHPVDAGREIAAEIVGNQIVWATIGVWRH